MSKVGYVFDPYMCKHECMTDEHPESPNRILFIFRELIDQNLIGKMIPVKTRNATLEELKLAHDEKYINRLMKMSVYELNTSFNSIYANQFSIECALLAVGSTLELTKNILEGKLKSGVAIVRPPSHHSCKSEAMGFCFFNATAIASIYARNSGKKVAIVDFDIHYGNHAETTIKDQKNINFFSIHRYDNGKFYFGSGHPNKNFSNIFNFPLNNIIAGDKEYLEIFNKHIIPNLKEKKPDIIIVSAGFDAALGDPLGGYEVTPNGYSQMIKLLKSVCPHLCLVLEGGYNLNSISKSMAECVKILLSE